MAPVAWDETTERTDKVFDQKSSGKNCEHGSYGPRIYNVIPRRSSAVFRQYKRLAEAAIAQVADDQRNAALDPEMNSIALIVKHLAGNMRSRWTDFLNKRRRETGP